MSTHTPSRAPAEIAERTDPVHPQAPHRVLYDGQCEICQGCVAWLKILDHESKALPLPISPEVLSTVDSRLRLGRCFPFRSIGRLLYGFVATNRYSLSKCRGGACRVAKPEAVRQQARLGTFWSCYTLGFFIRLPLVLWAGLKDGIRRVGIFARTYHKRLDLLNGKLTILFLNGFLPNAVPVLFGELFTTVLYHELQRLSRHTPTKSTSAT